MAQRKVRLPLIGPQDARSVLKVNAETTKNMYPVFKTVKRNELALYRTAAMSQLATSFHDLTYDNIVIDTASNKFNLTATATQSEATDNTAMGVKTNSATGDGTNVISKSVLGSVAYDVRAVYDRSDIIFAFKNASVFTSPAADRDADIKTANFSLAPGDFAATAVAPKIFYGPTGQTVDTSSAETAYTDAHEVEVWNNSGFALTFDPNGTETILGEGTTYSIPVGEFVTITAQTVLDYEYSISDLQTGLGDCGAFLSKSTSYAIVPTDMDSGVKAFIEVTTSGVTISTDQAESNYGSTDSCIIYNNSAGSITIDPFGSEEIGGQGTTYSLASGRIVELDKFGSGPDYWQLLKETNIGTFTTVTEKTANFSITPSDMDATDGTVFVVTSGALTIDTSAAWSSFTAGDKCIVIVGSSDATFDPNGTEEVSDGSTQASTKTIHDQDITEITVAAFLPDSYNLTKESIGTMDDCKVKNAAFSVTPSDTDSGVGTLFVCNPSGAYTVTTSEAESGFTLNNKFRIWNNSGSTITFDPFGSEEISGQGTSYAIADGQLVTLENISSTPSFWSINAEITPSISPEYAIHTNLNHPVLIATATDATGDPDNGSFDSEVLILNSFDNIKTTDYAAMIHIGSEVMLINYDSTDDTSDHVVVTVDGDGFVSTTENVAIANFNGSKDLVEWEGYGISIDDSTNTIQHSDLNDLTTWNALSVVLPTWTSRTLQRLAVLNGDLWAFADDGFRIYYNSGNPTGVFFSELSGAGGDIGINARKTLTKSDNELFWLDNNNRILIATGANDIRDISPDSMEEIVGGMSTISDAEGLYYEYSGHRFYQINFPTEDRSFVYDISVGMWHERTTTVNSTEGYHAATHSLKHKGLHLLTGRDDAGADSTATITPYLSGSTVNYSVDFTTNDRSDSLYTWDATATSEYGTAMEVERTSEHLHADGSYLYVDKIILDVETTSGSGTMTLEYSKDGGNTWSNTISNTLPSSSENLKRIMVNRLGRGRNWTFRLKSSAAADFTIVDGFADVRVGVG